MSAVLGSINAVFGTRHSQKPCGTSGVPGVLGVLGIRTRVRVLARTIASAKKSHALLTRAYTPHTLHTLHTKVIAMVLAVSGTPHTFFEPSTAMNSPKKLRLEMPETAAFIDDLRAAFGAEVINAAIRAGIDGQPTFHARENGHEVGTPIPYDSNKVVRGGDVILGPNNPPEAQQIAQERKRHGR